MSAFRMQDVAERASVSRATVSLVLSGRPGTRVSPPTVRRVLQAAAELGYEPRRGSDGGWVALVVEASAGAVLDLLGGALEEAWLRRCATVVVPLDVDGEGLEDVADALARGPRDRVAYLGVDEPTRETLSALPIRPRVVSCLMGARSDASKPYQRVLADDEHAASRTAEVLALEGHRRVAIVADPAELGTAGTWKRGLERIDLGFLGVPIVLTSEVEHAPNGLGKLFGKPPAERPTVLVCTSRRSAGYTSAAAAMRGLVIPGDVSIVVRDDGGHEPLGVPHTSFPLPARAMGRAAVQVLLETAAGTGAGLPGWVGVKVPFEVGESKPSVPT